MEIEELKNNELKNLLDGLNSRAEMTGDHIRELEDREKTRTQPILTTEKKNILTQDKQRLRDL